MKRSSITAFFGSLSLGFLLALAGMAALLGAAQLRVDPFAPEIDHGQVLLEALGRHEADQRRPKLSAAALGGYETTAGVAVIAPSHAKEESAAPPEARQETDRPVSQRPRTDSRPDVAYGPSKAFTAIDRNAP